MLRALSTLVAFVADIHVVDTAAVSFRGSAAVSEEVVNKVFAEELSDSQHQVPEYEDALRSMYHTLPKNGQGLLEHETVRYALRRFFLARNGWFIRGLEPENASYVPPPGKVLFVKEWVPGFLQASVERLGAGGVDLHGVAVIAATLEDLIRRELGERLGLVYQLHHQPEVNVSLKESEDLLYTYLITFVLGNNFTLKDDTLLARKRANFAKKYRGYDRTMSWFTRLLGDHFGALMTEGAITPDKVNFESNVQATLKMARSYHDYNEKECHAVRATLQGLESRKAGRVRLSTFYNMSFSSHWKFIEKKEYLRAVGALDESDPKVPSIIISNYVLGRANCLDASNLFSVCCRNTCDDLFASLEKEVNSDAAPPDRLAALVANLSSQFVAAPRILPDLMTRRLQEIAANHNGEVPLHGRLFNQWMHHAYPLECPFPHELSRLTPEEWSQDDGIAASRDEMQQEMDDDLCAVDWQGRVECKEESTELPWSMTEDVLHTYQARSRNPSADGEVDALARATSGRQPRSSRTCFGPVLMVPVLVVNIIYIVRRFSRAKGGILLI